MFKELVATLGFPVFKQNKYIPPVRFWREAAAHGNHGTIVVNSRANGLKDAEVRFAFEGMTHPPKLTPQVLEYIWDQAAEQSFVPQYIASYANVTFAMKEKKEEKEEKHV